jgi:ABC-type phosphate transport system substrate-binding protein
MFHRPEISQTRQRLPQCGRRVALLALGSCAVLSATRDGFAESGEVVGNFQIIVNPENRAASLSREFLANAFLRNVRDWDGGLGILPVDLSPSSSTRDDFSRRILLRSVAAVRSYWQQRIFAGRGVPPPELESDAAVVRYVVGNRGAVGYVSRSAELGVTRVVRVH